jgi:hypothetical protein
MPAFAAAAALLFGPRVMRTQARSLLNALGLICYRSIVLIFMSCSSLFVLGLCTDVGQDPVSAQVHFIFKPVLHSLLICQLGPNCLLVTHEGGVK